MQLHQICFFVPEHVPRLCLGIFIKDKLFTATEKLIVACSMPTVPCRPLWEVGKS